MNSYKQGQHICSLFDTPEEQRLIAAEYIADGLARGERCFYVTGSVAALEEFHQSLARTGTDVSEALRTTALQEATYEQASG